jgi:hypothetical protein
MGEGTTAAGDAATVGEAAAAAAAEAATVGEAVTLGEAAAAPAGDAAACADAEAFTAVDAAVSGDAEAFAVGAAGEAVTAAPAAAGALGLGLAAGLAWRASLSSKPSRRAVLWRAVRIVSKRVMAKRVPPRYAVALVNTEVVCAPKIFSVIPDPKAAPRPSLFGRCIRTTSVRSRQTNTRSTRRSGIRIDSHIIARGGICAAGQEL